MGKTIRSNAIQNIFTIKSSHDSGGNRISPEFDLLPQPMKTDKLVNSAYNLCNMVFDGTYLYVGCDVSVAKVLKIDPLTMAVVGTWAGAAGENRCVSVAYDGTYIYAGLYISPAKVIQIDPVTMTTVLNPGAMVWTGAGGENLCTSLVCDGVYVYAGLEISPAKVIQIRVADMTPNATWTGSIPSGENACSSLIYDGATYVYAGLETSPAKVIKIDTATMLTAQIGPVELIWTGAGGENVCNSLTYDGVNVYAGLGISPAKVIKIDTSVAPMVTVPVNGIWTGNVGLGENDCYRVFYAGGYIYAGLGVSPAKMIKIIPATMTKQNGSWDNIAGYGLFSGITTDGLYIYVCTFTNGSIIRINPGEIYTSPVFEVDGYAGIEVFNFSDVTGTVYVFNGVDPVALAARVPSQAAAYFLYNDPSKESIFWYDTGARYAKVIYITDGIQEEWEFSIQLKTKSNDIMPVTGIVVDKNGMPTKRIKPITVTEDCRLRADNSVTVNFPKSNQTNVYNAGTIPYDPVNPVLLDTFDVITEQISKFTISTRMGDQNVAHLGGKIMISYRADVACDWESCENLTILPGEKFDKIFIPTRRYYAINYLVTAQEPNGGPYDTVDFDFVVMKYPVPT
jgi:hypothetical protein